MGGLAAAFFTSMKNPYDAVKMRAQMGHELKQARSERGLSLEAASGAASISQGYLHKLEAGGVGNPSPRVLQRLSAVVGVPYRRLMELAGYVMPDEARSPASRPRSEASAMTPDEPNAVAPTNATLMALLEAVRAELAEVNAGQRQLTRMVEQLTKHAA